MEKQVVEVSDIACPVCGHHQQEKMPLNACLYFYLCKNCNTMIRPKEGDCCVFCSYGSMPCPPVQKGNTCSR